jgi:L-2-hydroxyglutarate oxidase LhgO
MDLFYVKRGYMEKIGVAIIGGGVVGLAVLHELASAGFETPFLFEQMSRVGEGQSSRNSGVVHSGIFCEAGTLKAEVCVESNALMYSFCERNGVSVANTGKLVVAVTVEQIEELENILDRAKSNGVPGVEMLTSTQIRHREPNVEALAGLYVPTAGIVDAAGLTIGLAWLAEAADAHIFTDFQIVCITGRRGNFEITGLHRGIEQKFEAEVVINAAGLNALSVARMINPNIKSNSKALRGEYFSFNRSKRKNLGLSGSLVYPLHETVRDAHGRFYIASTHLTPTFATKRDATVEIGNVVNVGPIFSLTHEYDDLAPPRLSAEFFAAQCRRYFPNLNAADLEPNFAGVMAAYGKDFVVKQDEICSNCIHLLGIGSPGLTSALSLARRVHQLLHQSIAPV